MRQRHRWNPNSSERNWLPYKITETARKRNQKNIWQEPKSHNITNEQKKRIPVELFLVDNITSNAILDYYRNNQVCNSEFRFKLISKEDVKMLGSSAGSDGIGIRFVQLCVPYFLPFLINIIYSIFLEDNYHICWKQFLVIPIPKNNNINTLFDLRPLAFFWSLKAYKINYGYTIEKLLSRYWHIINYPARVSRIHLKITDEVIKSYDDRKFTGLWNLVENRLKVWKSLVAS